MNEIEQRAAAEAREVLTYFEHLEALGKFASEPTVEQKQTFLTFALVNFARREMILHKARDRELPI